MIRADFTFTGGNRGGRCAGSRGGRGSRVDRCDRGAGNTGDASGRVGTDDRAAGNTGSTGANVDSGTASFRVSGHSGYAAAGADIVCAAVSSAVMFTVNAADRLGGCTFTADENIITCRSESTAAYELIQLLYEHLCEIQNQYPGYITVKRSD